jgi:hypothetical protein
LQTLFNALANLQRLLAHGARPYHVAWLVSQLTSLFGKMATPNKKPAAPGSTASMDAPPSKKRKMDKMDHSPTDQKYYAVRVGYKPGVYTNWAICQQQITGYKGAICGPLLLMPRRVLPPR